QAQCNSSISNKQRSLLQHVANPRLFMLISAPIPLSTSAHNDDDVPQVFALSRSSSNERLYAPMTTMLPSMRMIETKRAYS
ncbi:MAG: hypothetical protein ACRDL7_07010, partial [Gaiellaceae bacterium]